MNIIQILPEFHEGGVERHVLWLSNALADRGHRVLVVSAGGKLLPYLSGVEHLSLPVHLKNPFTACYSTRVLSRLAKKENWEVIHAHSRVPAWISWWTSCFTSIPWIVTCHANYSLNMGLKPYKNAWAAICVSSSVKGHMKAFLPFNSRVISNGLPEPDLMWNGTDNGKVATQILFIGRLTRIKGVDILLEALGELSSFKWHLDIVGDGPMRTELESLSHSLGLSPRVTFHGFREDTDEWMRKCSFMIFPSRNEGMPLTLCRAIQMKVPFIASDIPPIREIVTEESVLFSSGVSKDLAARLSAILEGESDLVHVDSSRILNISEMVDKVEEVYRSL